MARVEATEDVILGELPRIIAWLEVMGLPARNSRFARYEARINKYFKEKLDPDSEEARTAVHELSQAYRECIDIFLIYQAFKDERHPNFICTLSKVVRGQDVPDLVDAGPSRNYQFELLVSARFKASSYEIDFDTTTDVVARRDGLLVRIECKRLASINKLKTRIDEAAEQLERAMTEVSGKTVGLIYIDVSSCIESTTRQEVGTVDDAAFEIARAMQLFLHNNRDLVESLNDKHVEISHATCLIGTLPIWTRETNTVHASSNTAVRVAEVLPRKKYRQLKLANVGLENAFPNLMKLKARE